MRVASDRESLKVGLNRLAVIGPGVQYFRSATVRSADNEFELIEPQHSGHTIGELFTIQ